MWAAVLSTTLAAGLATVARAEDFPNGVRDTLGLQFGPAPHPNVVARPMRRGPGAVDSLRYWNQVAIDASGIDHTPVATGESRVFGEQLGPGRSSRAMAIVHIAIFDAINAIVGGYRSYTGLARARGDASVDAAIAAAAHDTLAALFPSQANSFDALLVDDLNSIHAPTTKAAGIAVGKQAAAAILALRASDGSQHAEPRIGVDYIPGIHPGEWRPDPVSQSPLALGAQWGTVTPFVLVSGDQFRAPLPPSLDSPEYAAAFAEVARMGGDGITTANQRTAEQTEIGIYWAYDGTPSLCAPPRLYNQIAMLIADQRPMHIAELARMMALVNIAMADAGIAIWESKYHYEFWRPVTGIRESDAGTGPTGAGDGNPATIGDVTFTPLGAPASNLHGPNFTPPFPAYPSGHAGFGGALFQMLRQFMDTDSVPFTFVSDEFNGKTLGNDGNPRPAKARSFATLSQAEEENGQSRIYLGIHWAFDKTEGIAMGRRVADYVFNNALIPVRER
jgi:hypothetical protein